VLPLWKVQVWTKVKSMLGLMTHWNAHSPKAHAGPYIGQARSEKDDERSEVERPMLMASSSKYSLH